MSTTLGTATTNLMDRVRDSLGTGLSISYPVSLTNGQTFAHTILSEAQRIINSLEGNYLVTVSYAITPYQVLYNISSDAVLGNGGSNEIIRIIGIQDGDMDLNPCPFSQVWQTDLGWFRRSAIGGQPSHTWFKFGSDCFGIYPSMTRAYSFNIVAVPYIANMTTTGTLFSVTDDVIPQVMDMAETMALFKLGEYKLAQQPLQRLMTRYKATSNANVWNPPKGDLSE